MVFSLGSFYISLFSTRGNSYNYGMHATSITNISDVPLRISVFYATTSLCGVFSGLLAAAIDQINGKGGKPGWAWIFILVIVHQEFSMIFS